MDNSIYKINNNPTIVGNPTGEYVRSAESEKKSKVEQEFLAIFYKELLKQAFKTPDFGLDEDSHSQAKTMAAEILVDKLALELAKKGSFSAAAIMTGKVRP